MLFHQLKNDKSASSRNINRYLSCFFVDGSVRNTDTFFYDSICMRVCVKASISFRPGEAS